MKTVFFSKDLMGKRHYYYRFYNENGIELYTLENKRDSWPTIFIPCDGFMVASTSGAGWRKS